MVREEDRVQSAVWNGARHAPPVIYHPPPDAPKWRGQALHFYKYTGRDPAWGINHRAIIIAGCFEICKNTLGYDSSSDEDEDEKEEEVDEREVERDLRRWMGLLDELQAYDAESIDVAAVLLSHGYFFAFLRDVLSNKHACIRAKAAELITNMVQNHPTSQQLLIDEKGIQLLLHTFTTDPDTTTRAKALGAISSLIWNNNSGITIFLQEDGYQALGNALNSGTVLAGSSTHNEVLNLIGYLRHDSEVQEARKGGNSGQLGNKPKQYKSKKRKREF